MPIRTVFTYFAAASGLVAIVAGVMALLGWGHLLHHLLDDRFAGGILIGFGVTMLLAAVFPFLVYHLTRRENERDGRGDAGMEQDEH